MHQIFRKQLRRFLLIFFDDILIYNKTWEEHLKHINEALGILVQESLYAKASKREFGLEEILYLGHKINSQGVSVDEEKIKAIKEWPKPRILTHLRGFVGLCIYHWWFFRGFSKIVAPLTDITKEGAFAWNEVAQQTFENIKEIISFCLVLAIPYFTLPFELECEVAANEWWVHGECNGFKLHFPLGTLVFLWHFSHSCFLCSTILTTFIGYCWGCLRTK